ncbi:MAG: alpha/beta hydrolase [Leptospiraceae bacterium]|nr:alpha/beta hydrolase [Leptospiraceae bacterium]
MPFISSVFYYPDKKTYILPEQLGLYKEDILLTAKDGVKLHLLRIYKHNQENDKNTVIFQFHGNAQNLSSHFSILSWLVDEGYELFSYDYRGYGKSGGSPNPKDINSDSILALIHVIDYCKKNNKKLIIYGQSLGGAISVRAFREIEDRNNIILFILEGTFPSYRMVSKTILQKILPFPIPYIASFFVDSSYSSENYIKNISPIPLFVIHEKGDPVVPFSNGREVFRLGKEPKIFWELNSDGHISWMEYGRNSEARKFLNLINNLVLTGKFSEEY